MVSFLKRYQLSPNWNAFTRRSVAASPAASRPPLSHFFSTSTSPWGAILCLPSFSPLKSTFLHCGVHPYHSMQSLWSSSPRQCAALAHFESLPPHDLLLWTDGSVPFPFEKGGSGVLANCSLCGTEITHSISAGLVCSSFSAKAHTILYALC